MTVAADALQLATELCTDGKVRYVVACGSCGSRLRCAPLCAQRSEPMTGVTLPETTATGDDSPTTGPADDGQSGDQADDDVLVHRLAEHYYRDLKARDVARRRIALERNAHRPRIADGVIAWDDLDSIEPPTMLMEALIPDLSIGFLSGRSGAYKSFCAVGWTCAIAGGVPWLDREEFRVHRRLKTLYVAAEGGAGTAARARAYGAAHGLELQGWWFLYPRPILLNDEGQAEELEAYVKEHGIEFIVIDTYRRSSAGSEENSSSDFGTIFEAVAKLRDDHGCSVQFLDHTGHNGEGRPVGAEAKIASADYVLSTMYKGDTRESSVQRELFVIKLKDQDSDGRWRIRLSDTLTGFPIAELGDARPADADDDVSWANREWWKDAEALPPAVAALTGRGAPTAVDVYRVLRYVQDVDGLTREQITRALKEAPRPVPAYSTITAAFTLLKGAKVTVPGRTPSLITLAPALRAVVRIA